MLDKMDVLKAFLNADQGEYQVLINRLNDYSKSALGMESGLPNWDDTHNHVMKLIISEWVYKFIANLE